MSKHEKFILTSISSIPQETLISCTPLHNGINSYPLCEYIMQTTFLKMTGASEQKIKCILWELATDNYDFRYEYLKDNYGECSNYESKEKAFQNLLKCISKNNSLFEISESEKQILLDKSISSCNSLFDNSIFSSWLPKENLEYKQIIKRITTKQFYQKLGKTIMLLSKKDNLSEPEKENNLRDMFDSTYEHRNRCAHNLLSYQDNLPSLDKLKKENYKYDNWFLRFFILILLDNIFIYLFKEYIKSQ